MDLARDLVAAGYPAVKVSIGRGDLEDELATVQAISDAVRGEARLLVDAHGAYNADSVRYVARRLQDMSVDWFEDPLPPGDLDGCSRLAAAFDLAIAGGETDCTRWQFAKRLSAGAADVVLPDVCRAGGISEGLHNVRWATRVSMGSSVHIAAAAHLAAASSNFLAFEWPSTPNPLGDPLLTVPLHPVGGILTVPDGPGLGIAFDEEVLRAHLDPEDAVRIGAS